MDADDDDGGRPNNSTSQNRPCLLIIIKDGQFIQKRTGRDPFLPTHLSFDSWHGIGVASPELGEPTFPLASLSLSLLKFAQFSTVIGRTSR